MTARPVALALQGGGAHGAFTWGVLDRLLEDDTVEIAAISGTSAGALNGAALKSGLLAGGRQGARDTLAWLWGQVVALPEPPVARWLDLVAPPSDVVNALLQMSPGYVALDAVTRAVSPYALGTLLDNPLRRIVEQLDFGAVCAPAGPPLFIGATNVRTGKVKVFAGDEIGTDAILASACLPTLFRAVEIGGQAYWDGGYSGNPALFPLFDTTLPADIVVVNINPLTRDEVPRTAAAIANRINEISFNAALLRELRAIRFVQRLLDAGTLPEGSMKRVRLHMIADDDLMNRLGVATKTVPTPVIVGRLFDAGRAAAAGFLERHGGDLGRRDSVDLAAMFG